MMVHNQVKLILGTSQEFCPGIPELFHLHLPHYHMPLQFIPQLLNEGLIRKVIQCSVELVSIVILSSLFQKNVVATDRSIQSQTEHGKTSHLCIGILQFLCDVQLKTILVFKLLPTYILLNSTVTTMQNYLLLVLLQRLLHHQQVSVKVIIASFNRQCLFNLLNYILDNS